MTFMVPVGNVNDLGERGVKDEIWDEVQLLVVV